MFCPNCGSQNDDASVKCQSCGFALQQVAAKPKFKGTMMMDGPIVPPGMGVPRASSAPPASTAEAEAVRPRAKGTMIGVAPPGWSATGVPTPESTLPSTVPPAPMSASTGVAPTAAMPATKPHSVNPLSGTMVATAIPEELQQSIQASVRQPPMQQMPGAAQYGAASQGAASLAGLARTAEQAKPGLTATQILLCVFTFGLYYVFVIRKQS